MSNFRVNEIFDDLKEGRISETEAEWDLRRIESSSCMRSRIDSIVRDTVYGRYDSYEASREFDRAKSQCDYNRRQSEQEEKEYWGY